MALDMDRTVASVTHTDAYHKIHYVSGNKDNMHVTVRVYKDSAAEVAAPNEFLTELGYTMADTDLDFAGSTPWGGNNIKQAYDHLASLDEYSTAVAS